MTKEELLEMFEYSESPMAPKVLSTDVVPSSICAEVPTSPPPVTSRPFPFSRYATRNTVSWNITYIL
jgi:hypothetical protein